MDGDLYNIARQSSQSWGSDARQTRSCGESPLLPPITNTPALHIPWTGLAGISASDLELTSFRSQDSGPLLQHRASADVSNASQDEITPDIPASESSSSSSHARNGPDHINTSTTTAPTGQPAMVATRGKRKFLLQALIFHLPSTAMSIFLTVLYARQVVWPLSEAPSNGVAQLGIQVLAQLHETLVVLSLSNILLHRLRYHLLQAKGIELGFLYANYRVGSPFYCFSSELWGATRKGSRDRTTWITAILVLLATIISLALSPLSAILLTPHVATATVPTSQPLMRALASNGIKTNTSGAFEVELSIPEVDLLPMSMGPSLGVTWACDPYSGVICSNTTWFNSEYGNILLSSIYRSMTTSYLADSGGPELALQGLNLWYDLSAYPDEEDSVAVTSPLLLTAGVGGSLAYEVQIASNQTDIPDGLAARMSWATGSLMRQPLVFSQACYMSCSRANGQNLTDTFLNCQADDGAVDTACFSAGLYPPFGLHFDLRIASFLADQDWANGFTKFVDLGQSVPYSLSTAAVTGLPPAIYNSSFSIYEIVIDALVGVWADADSTYGNEADVRTPGFSGFVARPGNLHQSPETYSGTNVTAEDIVEIDAEWMNSLIDMMPWTFSNLSVGSIIATTGAELAIPLIVAATMAAAPCSFGICETDDWMHLIFDFSGESNYNHMKYNYSRALTSAEAAQPGNHTTIRVKLYANFDAYRFSNSWLVILGFVFIYLHLALIIVHLAIITNGSFWTGSAWSNMGDLIALAMRGSRGSGMVSTTAPRLLADVGTGVHNSRPWGLRVRVCESEEPDGDRLKMVLKAPGDDGAVSEGEGRQDAGLLPQAEKKYW